MGHAVTIGEPLRINQKTGLFGRYDAYETTGTPVDCVKLAVDRILHRKPDLLVSGINHGSNSSINVIYSGTMSAAVEGAIEGIPSVGFSLCNYAIDADFTLARQVATQVTQLIMANGLMPNTLLNVNIPNISGSAYKGLKICRQSAGKWKENFEERTDPYRKKYYWMVGEFQLLEHSTDTDEWALANQFASVVPVQFDLTAHHAIPYLNQWNLEG
jgi:5'-nucleotidase